MSEELVKAFVTKADGKVVRVKLIDSSFQNELSNLGFVYDSGLSEYTFLVSGNQEKAELFDKLRVLEVNFSDGREWCPAEVFEYLRETGLLSGSFKKISWSGPGDYHLTVD
ncbi:hypothetical protein EXA23_09825 [Vibrio cincinnatiensis]|uniref:hypothetical protein n=1 Tax=Vibrio cincinnatiensis TaxID=675 RepID=UPI001EE06093|nr:hypothetical protein [Vibrio cincinnatiensis]MCG3766502.1 hypothetical protein [Vibrio cincinnatiensis]